MVHDRTDAIDADPGIFRLAIPNASVQPFDFRHDYSLRRHPRRNISRLAAGGLFRMQKHHSSMKPVQERQFGGAGIFENASKPRTTIGEGRQFGAFRSADSVEVPADQHLDVGVGSGNGSENLGATRFRFDVANPYFEVTFSVLATSDEGGIQGDRDPRRRRFRARLRVIDSIRVSRCRIVAWMENSARSSRFCRLE